MPLRRTARSRLVLAGVGVLAAVAAGLPPAAAPAAPDAVPAAAPAARSVTLPTGDRVAVRSGPGGRLAATPEPGSGPYREWLVGGDLYVVPASAERAAAADPAGFDVSALLRGGALAPRTVHPDFPMRTVTLDVTDDRGEPAPFAHLLVTNVDDAREYQGGPVAVDGVAKISVPDGHYGLSVAEDVLDAQGALTAERVVFAEFTVDGGAVTVPVDLRTATHRVVVGTPRPATPVVQDLVWYRGSTDADALAGSIGALPGDIPLYLSTGPASHGVQHLAVRQRLESPAGAAHPYLYDVRFPTDGAIGADQSYRVRPADLATVDTSYASDVPDRVGLTGYGPLLPWEQFWVLEVSPVTQPVRRTEYLTATGGMLWSPELFTDTVDWTDGAELIGGAHAYRPGQHAEVSWMAGPVAPGFPADTGVGWYGCVACRADDELLLYPAELTDAEPDHFGTVTSIGGATGHATLYQDGVEVADGPDGVDTTVTADPATYRLVYDQTTTGKLNTAAHVEWTFRSTHSGTGTLPSRWTCPTEDDEHCSAVSLLTLNYRLPQDLDNSVRPGPGTLLLTPGHTPGTPAVPVRAATLAVSFDRGGHWTPATLARRADGTYRASWTTPATAASGTISLRATARDTQGDIIAETLLDAVAVTPHGLG